MARVAWGCVEDEDEGKIVVGIRNKPTDRLRRGCLVFPGGHCDSGESYDMTAVRETKEETGLITKVTGYAEFDKEVLKQVYPSIISSRNSKENYLIYNDDILSAVIYLNGYFEFSYKDSFLNYTGPVIKLKDMKISKIKEQPGSDMKDPHWISIEEALSRREEFSPSNRILLEYMYDPESLLWRTRMAITPGSVSHEASQKVH